MGKPHPIELRQRVVACVEEGHSHRSTAARLRANHMTAMNWRELPTFMNKLQSRVGGSARTLEFIILTVTRSNEARGALWSEFDFEKLIWTIPAERMKRRVPHRVPLSKPVITLLEAQRALDDTFVFPSAHREKDDASKAQSDMVFKALYNRMGNVPLDC